MYSSRVYQYFIITLRFKCLSPFNITAISASIGYQLYAAIYFVPLTNFIVPSHKDY